MSFSLYRKFRPDTFGKLVRQEHVVTVLKNQIAGGAIGHAYLFCGPRGTGKTSVARIFARAVNCEYPVDGSPCGICPTCLALKEDHLDIAEIDAASNNGVNEMRELRDKVQYPPVTGKYRVYIIDEVHMLTDSAFNALLKTLEEPPAHAIFILATTEPHKIPATILSRCMRLDFKLIPEEDLEAHLMRILDEIGKPYEPEAVAAIARAGAGSDRDMLSIAEMCISYSDKLTYEGVTNVLGAADFNETSALCEALLLGNMPAALERVERVLSEGKAVGVLCRDILQQLNQIAVAKTCQTAEKLLSLPKTHFARIKEIAEKADGRAILRATEILAKTETELRFASSPRICLETAIMKTALPAADDSLDALLVRLNALEKAAAGAPLVQKAATEPMIQSEHVQSSEEPISEPPFEPSYVPPEEEPVFAEAYFADVPPEQEKTAVRQVVAEKKAEVKTVETVEANPFDTPKPTATPQGLPAELAFGKFIRILRKSSKNGVLFTMCSDLEASYEGALLVLTTTSPTVSRSLAREEHQKIMRDVFIQIGIADFEVRLKGEKPKEKDALKEFRETFKNYPIEIK